MIDGRQYIRGQPVIMEREWCITIMLVIIQIRSRGPNWCGQGPAKRDHQKHWDVPVHLFQHLGHSRKHHHKPHDMGADVPG